MNSQDSTVHLLSPGVHREISVNNWRIQHTPAGALTQPVQLPDTAWLPATVPGTVAQHCIAQGAAIGIDISAIEDVDWWYSAECDVPDGVDLSALEIEFAGLATIAEVWLNGQLLATSQSMFVPLYLPAPLVQGLNTLHLCFRSLTQALTQRRPRPSWKTQLIDQQQLRWFRTSLLGRMPSWTPPWPIVGPWKAIRCYEKGCEKSDVFLREKNIVTGIDTDNKTGWIHARFSVESTQSTLLQALQATLLIGKQAIPVLFQYQPSGCWHAEIKTSLNDVDLWWPHTHGEPALIEASLQIVINEAITHFSLGKLGFKSVRICRDDGRVAFVINGQDIFCRGACWTPQDMLGMSLSPEKLRQDLTLARDAGLNMLRIGGTMVYESDEFYRLCDELGILVWQDFMFANMDYPTQDPDFAELLNTEVQYQLRRLSAYTCIAAYCGGSEIHQQAAMMGVSPDVYANVFFDQELPTQCANLHPGIPYFVSSPCEGALPFVPDTGITHYYGVGAYRRPLADAELAQVKFTTECLGFSHVPEANVIEKMFAGKNPVTHSPIWKQGVPRDAGSGYDFEDVRDFYLTELYGIDPVALRASDTSRYLDASRAVTTEVLSQTLALFRSNFSTCQGALVWFWRDLRLGAGWGIVDSLGQPKAAYYGWKRASQPCALFLLDRGLNGLAVELINETAETLDVRLELRGFNAHDAETFVHSHEVSVASRNQQTLMVNDLLGYFADLTHSYKFGPSQHRLVHGRLYDVNTNALISEDFYVPHRELLAPHRYNTVDINVAETAAGEYTISLTSPVFLQWVKLDLPGFLLSNNYFHLAPHTPTSIHVRSVNSSQPLPLKGYLEAMNLQEALRIKC